MGSRRTPDKTLQMINRVLIRIKVVQILYSYLLVEKKFTLEEPPVSPTKEKRYAYGVYIEMLALLVMLSESIGPRRKGAPVNTRFIERIRKDDRIASACRRLMANRLFRVDIQGLSDKLLESAIFKNYVKDLDKGLPGAEDNMWREAFNQIVMTSPDVMEYAQNVEGYSLKGLERMQGMVNDTLTNFSTSQDDAADGLKTLEKSLDMARELYFRLLALAVDITDLQKRKLDANRHKYLKTSEDLNPNLKFVENEVIEALRRDETFTAFIEKNKINWLQEDPLLVESLLKAVLQSESYARYMESQYADIHEDSELWRELFRRVIMVNPSFLEALEEKSVFWNDDLDIMATFVQKTFRRLEEGRPNPILEKYKDDEDARFGGKLMRYVFRDKERYSEWVHDAVQGSEWEMERLAFMDVVVIYTALAEILNFPQIPASVSFNEYIEIAKSYSSARSGQFINGLLSCILMRLEDEGVLLKPLD